MRVSPKIKSTETKPAETKPKVCTVYTRPKKGQKTAALYVLNRSNLPDCAKRVGAALIWHANAKDGRCDPSQELLRQGSGLQSIRSVQKGLKALKRARFITTVRESRPHHSEAYQVQWELLAELQRRWEERHKATMANRRQTREAKLTAYKSGVTVPKATDILPGTNWQRPKSSAVPVECSPHERAGYPHTSVQGTPRPNPRTIVHPNSIELCEENSVKVEARRDEPSPLKRGSPRLAETSSPPEGKKGIQEEVVPTEAQASPVPQRKTPLLAAIKEGWEQRGVDSADTEGDPRLRALARLEGGSKPPPEAVVADDDPELPAVPDRQSAA